MPSLEQGGRRSAIMSFLVTAFNTILYQPLLNILVLLCVYLPVSDFGLSIIVLTILIKLLFYPLGAKAIKSQKILAELQPKLKEIQEKYKDDQETQTKMMLSCTKKKKQTLFPDACRCWSNFLF